MSDSVKQYFENLNWFRNNKNVGYDKQIPKLNGSPLTSPAKGIFKPKNIKYVLSIKKSNKSSYKDGSVFKIFTKGEALIYKEEKNNGSSFSNQALLYNLQDSMPVGVVIKTTSKPHANYTIHGCFYPIAWIDNNIIFCDEDTFFYNNKFDILEECYRCLVDIKNGKTNSNNPQDIILNDTNNNYLEEEIEFMDKFKQLLNI